MKHIYQVCLGQSTLNVNAVRETLSVFPSIISCEEERFQSLAGPTRNIRAYVEVAKSDAMTEQQQAAIESLGLEVKPHLFSVHWEPGEFEALQELRRKQEKEAEGQRREAQIQQGARYYVCFFRQARDNESVQFFDINAQPFDEYEQAQIRARSIEKQHYARDDYNFRAEARLAFSPEDARAGIFLDD